MKRPRRLVITPANDDLHQRIELSVGKSGLPFLAIAAPKRGCLGAELSREDAAKMARWLLSYLNEYDDAWEPD